MEGTPVTLVRLVPKKMAEAAQRLKSRICKYKKKPTKTNIFIDYRHNFKNFDQIMFIKTFVKVSQKVHIHLFKHTINFFMRHSLYLQCECALCMTERRVILVFRDVLWKIDKNGMKRPIFYQTVIKSVCNYRDYGTISSHKGASKAIGVSSVAADVRSRLSRKTQQQQHYKYRVNNQSANLFIFCWKLLILMLENVWVFFQTEPQEHLYTDHIFNFYLETLTL